MDTCVELTANCVPNLIGIHPLSRSHSSSLSPLKMHIFFFYSTKMIVSHIWQFPDRHNNTNWRAKICWKKKKETPTQKQDSSSFAGSHSFSHELARTDQIRRRWAAPPLGTHNPLCVSSVFIFFWQQREWPISNEPFFARFQPPSALCVGWEREKIIIIASDVVFLQTEGKKKSAPDLIFRFRL